MSSHYVQDFGTLRYEKEQDGDESMFTRGTPNKRTKTGRPSVSFVLRFSLKATMETVLLSVKHSYLILPLSLKNNKLVHHLP